MTRRERWISASFLVTIFYLLLWLAPANAATCFWVTGTAWNNSANWSATDVGATGGTCAATSGIPKNAGDIAKLATAAPAATTLSLDIDLSIAQIDTSALTGGSGIDLNGHAVTATTSIIWSGSGTRSITCGSGAITLTGTSGTVWDNSTVTNETFSCNAGTILLAATPTASRTFAGGNGKSYGTVGINNTSEATATPMVLTATTIATLSPIICRWLQISSGNTVVVTNAFSYNGTPTAGVLLSSSSINGGVGTLSVGGASTFTWATIFNITRSGAGTLTASSSFDAGGNNTGASFIIAPPSRGLIGG